MRGRADVVAALLSILLIARFAQAIPPVLISDEELAKQPLIVVGRWNKADVRRHDHVIDKIIFDSESHTELLVERVVSGDLKPGTHKILLEWSIGWLAKDGGPVMNFGTSEMEGDVKDVTESNLWFLTPKRSWDKTDPNTYPTLTTFRGVQPAVLEAYFRALASKQPGDEMARLLSSDQPLVIERALKFLSGGALPWPYGSDFLADAQGVKRQRKPMTQYATRIEELLSRTNPQIRQQATAVYAEMAGKKGIPRLRHLLQDRNAEVRAVAAGALIAEDDRVSGDDVVRAMVGRAKASMACQLIDRLKAWKSPYAIPASIEFLQHDEFCFRSGDDIGMPALKARIALKELSGYDFPADVSASRAAWKKVESITDAKERVAQLSKILPNDPNPLIGCIVHQEKGAEILVLTNRSKSAIVLLRQPTEIDFRWPSEQGGVGGAAPSKREDFVEIGPGESARLLLDLSSDRVSALERMTVLFLRNGNEFGVNAWIGVVDLTFDKK
jgi:hypothetical protein